MLHVRVAACAVFCSLLAFAQIPNDVCATPLVVQPGINPAPPAGVVGLTFDTTAALTESVAWSSCAPIGRDAWFSYTATSGAVVAITTCVPEGFPAGSLGDTVIAVYAANICGGGPAEPIACNDDISDGSACAFKSRVSFLQSAGSSYLIRVGSYGLGSGGTFYLSIGLELEAANNEAGGAIVVQDGVNPFPPTGGNGYLYSTAGSTPATTLDPTAVDTDVFFRWTPAASAFASIALCPPNFQNPGSLVNAQLAVFTSTASGAPALPVSHVDYCPGLDVVVFDAIGGTTYFIRVATPNAFAAGTFYLTVARSHQLTLSAPLGPGSLKAEVAAGPPNAPYLSFFTLNGAGFPNGPFFGIAPSLLEIQLQLGSGAAPFIGLLDAQGDAVFGPLTGLPAGMTIYGVSLSLTPIGQLGPPTNPVAFTVP